MKLHANDTARSAYTDVQHARCSELLYQTRREILDAIAIFLEKFEIAKPASADQAEMQRWLFLRDQIYKTRDQIASASLTWFADCHEWNRRRYPGLDSENNAAVNAGKLLKIAGRIGH